MNTHDRSVDRGFTLIEVLVTLIVILIGLLGIAALQFKAQQVQVEAYQRSQAAILVEDMINRISANRLNRTAYAAISSQSGGPFVGVSATYSGKPGDAIAAMDIDAWGDALSGAAEGTTVGTMIGARGCIWADATTDRVLTVTVAWQGINPTTARTDNLCATGQYGDENLRRVSSATIRIADLCAGSTFDTTPAFCN